MASLKVKIDHFIKEYWRVLKLTKKPNSYEFKTIVKVSALGIGIIGMVGFAIAMVKQIMF